MPKLTNLFLAVLLICLTLNFCTKTNGLSYTDISGTYTDTITIGKYTTNIRDTMIMKKVIKINDSTFEMTRFFGHNPPNGGCDSALLHLKQDNTITTEETATREICVIINNLNSNYCFGWGVGYYDPIRQYLYIYHTVYGFDQIGQVVSISPVGLPPIYTCDQSSAERMKK